MNDFELSRFDSSLQMQTPEGIEFTLYPAGLAVRACAWVIDSFIQGVLLLFLIITGFILRWALGFWLLLILAFFINWFYHCVFEVFFHGQSPGKRFMGLRVVCGDGSPVSPGASLLRNLLRFADSFFSLHLIAFICMAISPGFRRLGDWAADTLVVYTDYARSAGTNVSPVLNRAEMPWLEGFPPVSPPRILDFKEKQAIFMFARRYPQLGKARADEIASLWLLKQDFILSGSENGEVNSAYLLGIARSLSGVSS